ncbi:hypothetical protein H6P81_020900 [Aristolochia fimbriata]|uniref:Cytochrome P450 n=1 Tax=Aristolochia fimbriata TaxID=158543 RepID=A0AAV7DVQ5_ARIFI|nr:hypothetical protein H6P81_020900 [Aristolochia fimbriata]
MEVTAGALLLITELQQAWVGALALILAFTLTWKYFFSGGGRKPPAAASPPPPEVPGRLPLIGHLHKLMDDKVPLGETLGDFADKHGSLYTIWIGLHRVVVVNSWEMAKECLATNDRVLASRPSMAAGKYLCYNFAVFGFSPYGDYWREIRKIATHELLSARRLDLLKSVRTTEVDLAVNDLYKKCVMIKKDGINNTSPIKVDMKEWFADLTFNNVGMTVVGKRYFGSNVTEEDVSEARKFRGLIVDFFIHSGNPVPSDAFPVLERFDIGGYIRAMKKTAKDLDSLASVWLKEHRYRRRQYDSDDHRGPDRDFLDVLLTIMDKYHFAEYDSDTVIKATCLTMFLGGTETTSVTLTWALALLLKNHLVLKKAQEELDAQVGRDRKVDESDIENLTYLNAIVKETLRLQPPGPLTAPREAMEDCFVGGYYIPAGTHVYVNMGKIQRDPRIWPDPLEFKPERFLTTNYADIDVKGQHFELIPFSSGRRMCAGVSFALRILHLTLARLLHGFDLETPIDEPIDMGKSPGLLNPKTTPLEVLLSPRLPEKLYA